MSATVDTISVISGFASIGSAIWAYIEAKNAAKSASKAAEVKAEIIERREIIELSVIHSETSRILKLVSKIGPSCTESKIRGVNCSEIASEVQSYCSTINEQKSHFSYLFNNEAEKLYESLKTDIEALSEAKDFTSRKQHGKNIYYKINDFLPIVKTLSQTKSDNVKTK